MHHHGRCGRKATKDATRIAIDAGPVVVAAAGEIFGDVLNIAARAQALAEPGSVVVTARVQRQVAGLFVAEERGSHELKGVPEPVTLFRLVRATPLRDKRRPGRAGTLYRHEGGRLRVMAARDVPSMFAATWRDHGCRGARIVARSFWLMASAPR
jgi:hypothetical protein